MNYCPKCGNELPDGAAFCAKCGAPAGPEKKGSALGAGLRIVALILAIFGFLSGIFRIGLVLDAIAIVLAILSMKLSGKGAKNGKAVAAIIIAGLSLVLCAGIFVAGGGLKFGDVTLLDDTITYGSENFQSELMRNIESEYTCKIADTNIDPNTLGTYYVELVYSKDGKEKTKKFDITVADKTPPEFEFTRKDAAGTVYAYLNDEASLLEGIILTDDCDGEMTATAENVKVEDVIFSVAGDYHAAITFSDSAGNSDTRYVDVRITEPEVSLREYVTHYIFIEDVEISDSLGGLNLRYRPDSNNILDGKFLDLTEMKYTDASTHYAAGSREDGVRLISHITFDADLKVIEETRDGLLLRSTLESARVSTQYKNFIDGKNAARPGGSVYLGPFDAFEDDPVVQELGGIRYFLGKTPEDLESVKVDLKTLRVVK